MLSEKEKEFKRIFKKLKSWSKFWLTPSARRRYNAADTMIEPAGKTLEFIKSIENEQMNFEEKLNLVYEFADKENIEEEKKFMMGSSYYRDIQAYIRVEVKKII